MPADAVNYILLIPVVRWIDSEKPGVRDTGGIVGHELRSQPRKVDHPPEAPPAPWWNFKNCNQIILNYFDAVSEKIFSLIQK
jgi:hypothetical protein